jgi:leucyl-tRNA synthetase
MQESWPEVNNSALEESKKEIIIQINGKLRGKLVVNVDLNKDEITKLVLQDEKLRTYLMGNEIKNIIHVKGKLVNYVI